MTPESPISRACALLDQLEKLSVPAVSGYAIDHPFGSGYDLDRPFGNLVNPPFGNLVNPPFGNLVNPPFGNLVNPPFGSPLNQPFGDLTTPSSGYTIASLTWHARRSPA